MNRDKFRKQARVLRQKKLPRMAAAKRPTVDKGIVKFDTPISQKATNIRTLSQIPTPNKPQNSLLSPQPTISPETTQPQRMPRKSKGCAGCKRNSKR